MPTLDSTEEQRVMSDSRSTELSRLLKLHRLTHNETQTEYAKRFGMKSPTAVSLWESGKRMVPEHVILAILEDKLPQYEVCNNCGGCGVVKI